MENPWKRKAGLPWHCFIYQHPEKAINPRWKMKKVLEESGMYREEVLEALGIEEEWLERYPMELSERTADQVAARSCSGGHIFCWLTR